MKAKTLLLMLAVAIALPAFTLSARPAAAADADTPVYDVQTARDIVTMVNANWQNRVGTYTDNYTYQDEIITINGKANMEKYLEGLFSNMDININLVDEAISSRTYIGTWSQVMNIPLTPFYSKSFILDGVSVLRYNADGRLSSQRDYYNEADIYAELPFIGGIIKFLRNVTRRKYLGVAE